MHRFENKKETSSGFITDTSSWFHEKLLIRERQLKVQG